MDQLLERKILPKLIQEETDHMNSPTPIKNIYFMFRSLQKKENSWSRRLHW